jgi:hypothetical protein
MDGGGILPGNQEREGNNNEVLERIGAILENIAFGQVTLKIQNHKVILIEKRETELID